MLLYFSSAKFALESKQEAWPVKPAVLLSVAAREKCAVHRREDALKERELSGREVNGWFRTPLGGACQSRVHSQDQAVGVQMGVGAKFGSPSRNSDERSGL
jgi:hypothetical protein